MTLLVICVAIGSVGSREKTNARRRRCHKSVATTNGQKSLVLLMHERNVSILVAATAETRPTKRSQKKNSP